MAKIDDDSNSSGSGLCDASRVGCSDDDLYSWRSTIQWVEDSGGFRLIFGGFDPTFTQQEILAWMQVNVLRTCYVAERLNAASAVIRGGPKKVVVVDMATKYRLDEAAMVSKFRSDDSYEPTKGAPPSGSHLKNHLPSGSVTKCSLTAEKLYKSCAAVDFDEVEVRFAEQHVEYIAYYGPKLERINWYPEGIEAAGVDLRALKKGYSDLRKQALQYKKTSDVKGRSR